MVEKWKSELVKNAVAEWLTCETDNYGKAKDLKCNLSLILEENMVNVKLFQCIYSRLKEL